MLVDPYLMLARREHATTGSQMFSYAGSTGRHTLRCAACAAAILLDEYGKLHVRSQPLPIPAASVAIDRPRHEELPS